MIRITFTAILALIIGSVFAQPTTVQDAWTPLVTQPHMRSYFHDLFDKLGVEIHDTGEKFTVLQGSEGFSMHPGIDADVNFHIQLPEETALRLVKHAADQEVDEAESYLILSILMMPMTQNSLNNPYMCERRNLRIADVEDHIHVRLMHPDGTQHTDQTLTYSDGRWTVSPGWQGEAERRFDMRPEDALLYQRMLFRASRENTNGAWLEFARWYKKWRDSCSTELVD